MAARKPGYQAVVFFVAGLTSLVAVALVLFRALYSGQITYLFLIWNLFLAWVPWFFSVLVVWLYRRAGRLMLPAVLCSAAWLLFFPNAPYIVTDLLHLQYRPPIPLWYDLFLIFSFAWAGLYLGFSSLYTMQLLVRGKAGPILGWLFALVTLGLSGFGIYLGRFLDWNSWDLLLHPDRLITDIADRLLHPLAHPQTLAVSLLVTLVLTAEYVALFALTRMPRDHGVRSEGAIEPGLE